MESKGRIRTNHAKYWNQRHGELEDQLFSVFHCQEMRYSLQGEQGVVLYQPDLLGIQLMSLFTSQNVREKGESWLSVANY